MAAEQIITGSAEETIEVGRKIAARLETPSLVLLRGELGAGKTTLAKGLIAGLGAAREEDVTSPTFTLVHVFGDSGTRENGARAKVYHADLYRIGGEHDLASIGLEDALAETGPCVVIVEWSERLTLRSEWPTVRIELEHAGGDLRRIHVQGLSTPGSVPGPAVA
jgi:tRNA threonylcarbamoyladenosine biosynthesis protein TsaE